MANLRGLLFSVPLVKRIPVTTALKPSKLEQLVESIPPVIRSELRGVLPIQARQAISEKIADPQIANLLSTTQQNPSKWQALLGIATSPSVEKIRALSNSVLEYTVRRGLKQEESFILGLLEAQAKQQSNGSVIVRLKDMGGNEITKRYDTLRNYKLELLKQLRTQLFKDNQSSKIINQLDLAIAELVNPVLYDPNKLFLNITS